MSSTKYVRKFRAKKKEQGLAEVRGIYLPKEAHIDVKKYAKKVENRINKNG